MERSPPSLGRDGADSAGQLAERGQQPPREAGGGTATADPGIVSGKGAVALEASPKGRRTPDLAEIDAESELGEQIGEPGPTGRIDRGVPQPTLKRFDRDAIVSAIRLASRSTPWIMVDDSEYRKCNPTK